MVGQLNTAPEKYSVTFKSRDILLARGMFMGHVCDIDFTGKPLTASIFEPGQNKA